MSSTRTPQEKKRLSYQRDGQPHYGQCNKGPRKHIPTHKRHNNRSSRHAARQALVHDLASEDFDQPDEALTRQHDRPEWRKHPDPRLGDLVELKLKRRAALGIVPKEVAEKKLEKVRRSRKKGR
jgi:hypothetical protein